MTMNASGFVRTAYNGASFVVPLLLCTAFGSISVAFAFEIVTENHGGNVLDADVTPNKQERQKQHFVMDPKSSQSVESCSMNDAVEIDTNADATSDSTITSTRPGHDAESCSDSALARARGLIAPQAQTVYGGEYEYGDWWEEHEALLSQARNEWGPLHPELYREFGIAAAENNPFIDADLHRAFRTKDRALLRSLIRPTNVPDVYGFRLFTPHFAMLLLEELDHHETSGIPLRRPNGMNRYGSILSDLGMTALTTSLVDQYLKPITYELFSNFVSPQDVSDHYAFTVRYKPGEDVSLAEHTDASTVTVNICLQQPVSSQNGENKKNQKVLYFKERRTLELRPSNNVTAATYVDIPQDPGYALIHLGQHVHGVSEVVFDEENTATAEHTTTTTTTTTTTAANPSRRQNSSSSSSASSISRSQLVIWMFGEYGYVRVAPYEKHEIQANKRKYYDPFWRRRE